ncbi:hypothetical protein ON010_g12126 [Phytophthora cinnamomi]|nr:hypothetical protein ON010_g12126 [Phytophthora cinnamomi]
MGHGTVLGVQRPSRQLNSNLAAQVTVPLCTCNLRASRRHGSSVQALDTFSWQHWRHSCPEQMGKRSTALLIGPDGGSSCGTVSRVEHGTARTRAGDNAVAVYTA